MAVTPLPIFLVQLQISKGLIDPLTKRTMNKGGDQIAATAKKNSPFLTGSLMRSIKNQGVKGSRGLLTLKVTAGGPSTPHDVDYAVYVHEGTSRGLSPRPFLRNALNKHEPQIVNELADLMALLSSGETGRVVGSISRG